MAHEHYGLKYTRTINGVPVNPDLHRGVGDGSAYTSGTEGLWMTVNDGGMCWLHYSNPHPARPGGGGECGTAPLCGHYRHF